MIFTDGHASHAAVAHNRFAYDVAEREVLRDTGRTVLACWRPASTRQRKAPLPPSWFAETLVQQLINNPWISAAAGRDCCHRSV